MNQRVWELWFLLSALVFGGIFFLSTIEGFEEAFPNFLWVFIPSIINLAVCVYYGTKQTK